MLCGYQIQMLLQVGWALLALTIVESLPDWSGTSRLLVQWYYVLPLHRLFFAISHQTQERAQGLFITGLDDQNDFQLK